MARVRLHLTPQRRASLGLAALYEAPHGTIEPGSAGMHLALGGDVLPCEQVAAPLVAAVTVGIICLSSTWLVGLSGQHASVNLSRGLAGPVETEEVLGGVPARRQPDRADG